MIARPKISRNEWKTTEIGASKVGNFALFSCPGAYADSDAAPLAPLEHWFACFGYSPHLAAQHVLVVGVEFPWACDGNELQLCQWAFAATTPQHPALYAAAAAAAANAKAIPFSKDNVTRRTGPVAFTKAVLGFLRELGRGDAVDALARDFAEPDGLYVALDEAECGVLVLPYRAFGYHPGPFHAKIAEERGARAPVAEPAGQRLVQHGFRGSWR